MRWRLAAQQRESPVERYQFIRPIAWAASNQNRRRLCRRRRHCIAATGTIERSKVHWRAGAVSFVLSNGTDDSTQLKCSGDQLDEIGLAANQNRIEAVLCVRLPVRPFVRAL